MSAFFVQPAVIDDIIDLVDPKAKGDARASLGRWLWELNAKAVAGRYDLRPQSSEYRDYRRQIREYDPQEPHPELGQRLKSFSCFIYQCSEHPVSAMPEFKLLNQLCDKLILLAADGRTKVMWGQKQPFVPGYEEARWDRSRAA